MMIDFATLPIGTKFYRIKQTVNLNRKKETKVIDGEIWYKRELVYDYSIDELVLVGRITKLLEGECNYEFDTDTEYLVRYADGLIDNFYPDTDDVLTFLRKDDAEAKIEQMMSEAE